MRAMSHSSASNGTARRDSSRSPADPRFLGAVRSALVARATHAAAARFAAALNTATGGGRRQIQAEARLERARQAPKAPALRPPHPRRRRKWPAWGAGDDAALAFGAFAAAARDLALAAHLLRAGKPMRAEEFVVGVLTVRAP